MLTCKGCSCEFPARININGRLRNLKNRSYCLVCHPFEERTGPRKFASDEKRRGKLAAQLKCRYKITIVDFEALQIQQNNKCAICRCDPPTSNKKRLSVDHETGQVRGLLCTACNSRLGWFETHREIIEKYLNALNLA